MKTHHIILKTLILVLLPLFSMAQTSFQVVSKLVEQELDYVPGNEVNIEGERAEILVDSWDESKVKVVILPQKNLGGYILRNER